MCEWPTVIFFSRMAQSQISSFRQCARNFDVIFRASWKSKRASNRHNHRSHIEKCVVKSKQSILICSHLNLEKQTTNARTRTQMAQMGLTLFGFGK